MKHIYAFRNHLAKDNTDFSVTQNCFYFHLEMLRCNQSEWNQIKSKSVDALTICWRNITFFFKVKIYQWLKKWYKLRKFYKIWRSKNKISNQVNLPRLSLLFENINPSFSY